MQLVTLDHRVRKVNKVHKAKKAQLVLLVNKDQLVHKVQLVKLD